MSLLRPAATTTERRAVTIAEMFPELERNSVVSWGGIPVTPRTALKNPAVYRSRNLICGLIAGFPVHGVQKVGSTRLPLDPAPQLLTDPSGTIGRRAWIWQCMESLVFDGNIVGQIAGRDRYGTPTQIEVLDMGAVHVRQDQRDRKWQWRIHGTDVPAETIWHVAFDPPPGHILGRSLLEHARDVIAIGLAAQRYAAEYFDNGAHPSMIARNTLKEIDEPTSKRVKERFVNALRSTSGRREPLVIGKGWEVTDWQSDPTGAALVDVWAANITNVVNYFGVPAELLGGKTSSSMTYTNLEARGIDLLKFCVGLWMDPLEQALTATLPDDQQAIFTPDALLRTDTLTRYRAHEISIRSGLDTPNHRRELEDLAPVPNGTETLWPPYRMFPLEKDE
jgi:HK97 family phage portal protein